MTPTSSMVLQNLRQFDPSSPDFQDRLRNALNEDEYRRCVAGLERDELRRLVDYLDGALSHLDPSTSAFRERSRELGSICSIGEILPTSFTWPSQLQITGSLPLAGGNCGDVLEGTLENSRVRVKCVRMCTDKAGQEAAKIFYKEAVVWKRLSHPNVVSLLSITTAPLQFISDWMDGGTLPEYIGKNPGADRLLLLSHIVNGLSYLHSRDVVHGNLKGSNVLIDAAGRARIADFDLATVIRDVDPEQSTWFLQSSARRWTAPEVLDGGRYSKEADIFSLAMVMVEVFAHAIPPGNIPPATATPAMVQYERPPRPTHPAFTETLWTLVHQCWGNDPFLRPTALEVLRALPTPDVPILKRVISYILQWVKVFFTKACFWS